MTIHSWCGIGIRERLTAYDLDAISGNRKVMERVGNAKVLIIDEVSMLSANTLAMADAVCREVRRHDEPFGRLQVVLVGDFFNYLPYHGKGTVCTPPKNFPASILIRENVQSGILPQIKFRLFLLIFGRKPVLSSAIFPNSTGRKMKRFWNSSARYDAERSRNGTRRSSALATAKPAKPV